jgi:3-dehydroquinate synthase
VIDVLDTFGLPVELDVDRKGALQILKMDKKKDNASMNYVLLDKIGKAVVKNIRLDQLEELILSV